MQKNQNMTELRNCSDCGVAPGSPHEDGCGVERCSVCGGLRFQCDCKNHDKEFARWTGIWPGKAEADYLGVDLNEFGVRFGNIFFIKPSIKERVTWHKVGVSKYIKGVELGH